MSRRAILPQSPHPVESYEGRLNAKLNEEIGDLKDRAELTRMNRLSGYNSASAAPTGNVWAKGDIVRNSNPVEIDETAMRKYFIMGWICTASGTPGSWKEMRSPSETAATGSSTGPDVVGCTFNGIISPSYILARHPFPVAVTFPVSLTDSRGQVDTVPTAQTDFDIRKSTDNGATSASIGTMRFALGARLSSFIFAAPVAFAVGNVLTVVAPASADATFAGIGFSLLGTR